jgi:hypothetical protein
MSDRASGTMLLVLGIVLMLGGILVTPVWVWVLLWQGYGDGGASAIGFGVLVLVLFGAGIAALVVGISIRSRPPQG